MQELVTPAEEATIRRFAASIRERGSRATSRSLRAEARLVLIDAHMRAAGRARREGRREAATAHIAWAMRLGGE